MIEFSLPLKEERLYSYEGLIEILDDCSVSTWEDMCHWFDQMNEDDYLALVGDCLDEAYLRYEGASYSQAAELLMSEIGEYRKTCALLSQF